MASPAHTIKCPRPTQGILHLWPFLTLAQPLTRQPSCAVLLTLCGGVVCRWLVTVCVQAVTWHRGNYPHHKSQLGGQINTQAAAASWQPRHGHHLDNIGGNSFNIDNVMNTQLYNYIISSLVPSPNIVYLYFHTVLLSKLRNPVVDSGQVTSWRQWLWLRVIRSSLGGK